MSRSPIRSLAVAIASAALLAGAQTAAAHDGDLRPGPNPERAALVKAGKRLGPVRDRKADVARVRKLRPGARRLRGDAARVRPSAEARKRIARRHASSRKRRAASRGRARAVASAASTEGPVLDMRLLVLSADGSEPTFKWWTDALRKEGVPFDTVVGTRDPAVTAETLRAGAGRGRYQAIITATGGLVHNNGGAWESALSDEEWAAIAAYEKDFGVREVAAYAYPGGAYGLSEPVAAGDLAGTEASVTSAGEAVFTELRGPVSIDRWSYGYQATPLPGSSWQTLVQGPRGALLGTYARWDGTEAMVNLVDASDWSVHGQLLFHGMLAWATRGVHLGMHRYYLGLDVDDVFLADDRWDTASNTTVEDRPVRMTREDVDRAVSWQARSGVRLNMLYNGAGAKAGDGLTGGLLAHKGEFRWTSHTYTHLNLDAAPREVIEDELRRNLVFAGRNGLAVDARELTTGEHSGLANPALPAALESVGVRWIGDDNSRNPVQRRLGPALSVPRHPMGVYYNVGTFEEQLDEYNHLNLDACPAGNAGCLPARADQDTWVDNEATLALRHVLDNDPRPHYVHQSNLAEDGTLYPVADELLARYRRHFRTPLVQLGTGEAGAELERMAAWRAAVAAGTARATVTPANGRVSIDAPSGMAVPVTGTATGELYGGLRSGWRNAAAPTAPPALPGGDPTPAPDPDPAPAPDPDPAPAPAPGPDPAPVPDPLPAPSASYLESVRADGAIGFWGLESADGTIADRVGGSDGFVRNGPAARVAGVDGAAARFDGGPAYVEINGVAAPQERYTLEAWVRFDATTDQAVIEHGGAGALALTGGRLTFRNVATDVTAPGVAQPGRWYHVAGTWDGTTARLYVDGAQVAAAASADAPSGTSTLYLGRGAIAPSLRGTLDAVGYYDRALAGDRVAAHHSARR